ncbi:EAL domain-containing protein [Aquihabitans sp. G128]|nr:EAL domain-containing protein [Aquihabitans sp. G128]QXC62772.1 EAL domain-containing protein [Aquihabitans sp. G128]
MVKLDREFIRGVDVDEARTTFVRFVGDLVGKLDTWLIAEGIETDGELDVVVGLGVPLGQGYRLGRPVLRPGGLPLDVSRRIDDARRAFSRPANHVAAHLEHIPAVRSIDRHEWSAPRVVLVDDFGCPLQVVDRADPGRSEASPMRVKPTDDVSTVAVRALSRGEHERWRPLVVTDDAGRYQGIIRMERLVRALSDERSTPT